MATRNHREMNEKLPNFSIIWRNYNTYNNGYDFKVKVSLKRTVGFTQLCLQHTPNIKRTFDFEAAVRHRIDFAS